MAGRQLGGPGLDRVQTSPSSGTLVHVPEPPHCTVRLHLRIPPELVGLVRPPTPRAAPDPVAGAPSHVPSALIPRAAASPVDPEGVLGSPVRNLQQSERRVRCFKASTRECLLLRRRLDRGPPSVVLAPAAPAASPRSPCKFAGLRASDTRPQVACCLLGLRTCGRPERGGNGPESQKLVWHSHGAADGRGGSDRSSPLRWPAGRLYPREEARAGRAVARPGALGRTGRWFRADTSSGRSWRGPTTSRAGGHNPLSGPAWTLGSARGHARLSSAISGVKDHLGANCDGSG